MVKKETGVCAGKKPRKKTGQGLWASLETGPMHRAKRPGAFALAQDTSPALRSKRLGGSVCPARSKERGKASQLGVQTATSAQRIRDFELRNAPSGLCRTVASRGIVLSPAHQADTPSQHVCVRVSGGFGAGFCHLGGGSRGSGVCNRGPYLGSPTCWLRPASLTAPAPKVWSEPPVPQGCGGGGGANAPHPNPRSKARKQGSARKGGSAMRAAHRGSACAPFHSFIHSFILWRLRPQPGQVRV